MRLFQVQLEHYEKVEGEKLSLEGKANQLSQLVRANLPAAMQGFVVVPLFAGFDAPAPGPRLQLRRHRRPVRRRRLPDQRLGRRPRPELDQGQWREGMTRDETVDLALRSLFAAADEDVATGGPDLVRGSSRPSRSSRRRDPQPSPKRRRREPQALLGGSRGRSGA